METFTNSYMNCFSWRPLLLWLSSLLTQMSQVTRYALTMCLGFTIGFSSYGAARYYGKKEKVRKHFQNQKKKILVVGAGYAGRSFLKDINTDIYDVEFVDKKLKIDTDVFEWFNESVNKIVFEPQPNYVDTLSENKVVTQFTVIPNGVTNVQGEVVNVDKDLQVVTLKDDTKLKYDYLVWATGSVPDTFNVKMNYDCSSKMWYYFKDIDDVKALMTAINLVGLNDVVVMGGGITGVELASELSRKISEVAAKSGGGGKANVTILEPSGRLLPKLKESISNEVTEHLKKQHINIITNANIEEINSGTIKLVRNGTEHVTLKAVIAVWTCGVKPDELLQKLLGGNQVTENLLLSVRNSQNQRLYNIFAIGDCNDLLPKSAQHSKQQGKYLANFFNTLGFQNPDLQPFVFESQGQMIRLSDRIYMDSPAYSGMLPLFVHRAIISLDL